MLNYPPAVTEICKYCGSEVTLVREGDGHPMNGRLSYWYTTDHECPEAKRVLEEICRERQLLEEMLAGTASADGAASLNDSTTHFLKGIEMESAHLMLTDEEREYLIGLLDTDLGDTKVEARHTDTIDYKERVKHNEQIIEHLLTKLRGVAC